MQKLLVNISTLTITFTSMIVYEMLMSQTAAAYCVYNNSSITITAVQLPLSERSFKAVIPPNNKSCCPWEEPTCTMAEEVREDAKTLFLIYEGNLDSHIRRLVIQDLVTVRRVFRTINSDLDPLIQNMLSAPGIPTIASHIAEQIYSLLDRYIPQEEALGVVQTYNGGIIDYNGSVLLGCWVGPCRGQDINGDGTRGPLR